MAMSQWNDQEAALEVRESIMTASDGTDAPTQLSLGIETSEESADRRNAHIIALMSMTSGKTAQMLEDALDGETDLAIPEGDASPKYFH